MTALKDVARVITLSDGESIDVSVHPSADVVSKPGQQGGNVYNIPVVRDVDGKKMLLRGGQRLLDAVQDAVGDGETPMHIRITAKGDARTLERDWTVVVLP